MVGGRLHRLTCFLASHAELLLPLLLLWFCLHDVEASECPSVVHKQVGDTVVLSSCLPSEGVTNADWIYKDQIVEDLEKSQKGAQFRGRTSLNRINLSLTVRRLTLQDSGVYRFNSEVNEVQRTTVTITLHVHDVEASECPSVVHKQVGDTVVFSSCLPSEGVTNALWIYKDQIVEDLEEGPKGSQFKGRTSLNRINLSLTVRRLTLQDSGVYRFKSEVHEVQRTTVTITLHVHALLTPPILTVNSSWSASNESCTVVLDCNSMSDSEVTYNWTVKSQTYSGSRLQYTIRPQEGGTTFTCTIFSVIGEQSFAEKAVKCDNITEDSSPSLLLLPLMSGLIIGSLLIILLLLPLVFCSQSKGGYRNRMNQSQSVNQDETQQHVYYSLSSPR